MISCKICGAKVPPEWKFAITNNTCPGCGEPLLDESSKELLDELRTAMTDMPNDPEGLAGWLLSNYRLTKVGDGEPVNFYGRAPAAHPHTGEQMPNPSGLKVNNNNPVHRFLKNAGASHLIDNPHQGSGRANPSRDLKSIVNEIHNNIEAEESALSSDYEYDGAYNEVYDGAYEEDYGYEPAVGYASQALANNSMLGSGGGPPPTNAEKAALIAALGGQAAGPGQNLHPALEADRAKRQQNSANVDLGVGKIKRSG